MNRLRSTLRIPTSLFIYGGYVLLSIFFTFPLVRHLRTHILHNAPAFGRGDPGEFFWWQWWIQKVTNDAHASLFFTDDLYYPTGVDLSLTLESSLNHLFGLFISPFAGPITTYNILVLFALTTSAFGAYLLIQYIVRDQRAAFIGGIIYGFSPFLLERTWGHLNILSAEWLPLFILFLFKTHREGGKKNIFLAILFFVFNAMSSWHYFIFACLFVCAYILFFCITDSEKLSRDFWKRLVVIASVSFLLLLPLIWPYITALKDRVGVQNSVGGSYYLSSDVGSFFIPAPHHFIYQFIDSEFGKNVREHIGYVPIEQSVFLGFFELILLIVWLWKVPKKKHDFLYFFVFLFFIILSLGSFLRVFGHGFKDIPLPYFFLYQLPGMSFMRTPNRFVVVVILMLAVMNAQVLKYTFQKYRLSLRRWKHGMIFGAIVVILLLERIVYPVPLMSAKTSTFFQDIGADEEEYVLFPLPIFNHFEYNYSQTFHHKPMIGGGIKDVSRTEDVTKILWKYPAISQFICNNGEFDMMPVEETRSALKELNVKYVVIYKLLNTPCPFSVERFVNYFGYENAIFEDDDIWVYQVYE